MGLLYVFPVSKEEEDFVEIKNDELTLKTYGLPYIFWFYAIAIITMIVFMFIAIKDPILKLAHLGDETDRTLAYFLLGFISILPLLILSFFFYEKRIVRKKNQLLILHRVFGISFLSDLINLEDEDFFQIESFLSSPNVARMNSSESNTGFQNKGYFILSLIQKNGKKTQLDRHSRKADLEKLKNLLELN